MDVVRHLLPDCVVFVTALASLVVNARVVAGLSRGKHSGEVGEGDEISQREESQQRSGDGMQV